MDDKHIIWNTSKFFYCHKDRNDTPYNGLATLNARVNMSGGNSKGTIKDGEHSGIWTFWYKNGKKQKQGECIGSDVRYNRGAPIPIGFWTFWHESGEIEKQGEYKRRKELISSKGSHFFTAKDGIWNYWNEDGNKIKEGIFKNGKADIFSYYFEDGNISQRGKTEYFSKQLVGSNHYSGYQPVGKWTKWYKNGQRLIECNYTRMGSYPSYQSYHGLYTHWYENGQKSEEVRYKWGKKVGIEKTWNEDGTLKFKKDHGRSLLGSLIR